MWYARNQRGIRSGMSGDRVTAIHTKRDFNLALAIQPGRRVGLSYDIMSAILNSAFLRRD